jgi:PmbA protein
MKKEMLDLANWVLKETKKAGADECVVGHWKSRSVEIAYRDRKPESIKEAAKRGLDVRIYVNGRYSGQSTSDIRKESLSVFIANAVATTKLLAEDPFRTLPDPKYYEGRAEIDLKLVDPDHKGFSPERRHAIAKEAEAAALSTGGDKIISVTSYCSDDEVQSVRVASNGFEGSKARTGYSIGAEVSMQDKGDRRPNGWSSVRGRRFATLPAPASVGKEASERTLDLLGAKKIKTETLPIIVENRNAGRVVGGLLGPMSGGNIQQKRSFLADKKGTKIAGDLLTLTDDPFIVGAMGSRLYGGDGFASRKRTMIDKGVLKEFFIGWYYSRKLGVEPTIGGSSNLLLPPGARSVPEIMMDLGRGIYVTGFLGGNSNGTTGDFSVGIQGMLFENGEPVQAVCEMNIADNHLNFWKKLIEVANDPWTYSSWRLPSLVFTDIVVAGV